MVFDPCAPVPDTTIPTGAPASHHHVLHHVVGRVRHRIHHVHLHAGPPAGVPNAAGCEKHAGLPGTGHGALPASPFPALGPVSKVAAIGGAAAGTGAAAIVAVGGLGGLIGGGYTTTPITKTSVPVPDPPVVVPPVTVTPPVVVPPTPVTPTAPTTPGTPPVNVPEPSSIVIFLFAVCIALAVRHLMNRRAARHAV